MFFLRVSSEHHLHQNHLEKKKNPQSHSRPTEPESWRKVWDTAIITSPMSHFIMHIKI